MVTKTQEADQGPTVEGLELVIASLKNQLELTQKTLNVVISQRDTANNQVAELAAALSVERDKNQT